MKRLNQNNTIAPTAMLTKTNTMKNKMNFFAKVVMLVVMMGMLLIQNNIFAATPVKNGDTWYSYYHSSEVNKTAGGVIHVDFLMNQDVYPPCSDKMSYEYKTNGSATLEAKYYYGSNSTSTDNSYHNNNNWAWSDDNHYLGKIPDNTYKFDIKITSGALRSYMRNISIELKKHIRLDNGDNFGTTNLTINEINDQQPHAKVGQAKKIIIPFRSFLTNGNITVTMASGDPNVFRVNNSSTACTTTQSYTVFSGGVNKCGTKEGKGDYTITPGSATACDIHVYFYPQNTTQQSATFTITDGTSTATATINAIGADNIMSFTNTYVEEYSASQSFTMTNFTGPVTVTAPNHFQVSADNSTWTNTITINSNKTFYVRFSPLDANPVSKSDNVTMTEASTGISYHLAVSGTTQKHEQTITWGAKNALTVNEELLNAATVTVGDGTLSYQSDNTNVIKVYDAAGQDVGSGWGVILQGVAGGSANITAKASATTAYEEVISTQSFFVTRRKMQTIVWTQDPTLSAVIPAASSSITVPIDAVAYEFGTTTPTGKAVTFSSSDNNIATIDNSTKQITFYNKGNVVITAAAAGDEDEPVGDESKYLPISTTLSIYVRKTGEACSDNSIEPTTVNANDKLYVHGKPLTLTGNLRYTYWAHFNVHIKDNNGNQLYQEYVEREVIIGADRTVPIGPINVNPNIEYIVFDGVAEGRNVWFEDIKITQQTYFTPENKASFDYSPTIINHTSQQKETISIDYSNLSEDIVATIADNDNGRSSQCFTVDKNFVAAGCYQYGTATFNIRYSPNSLGSHTATVTLSSKMSGGSVSKTITLTGSCTKETQSIQWNEPVTIFDNLNALSTHDSNYIDLSSSVTTGSGEVPTFTIYNQSSDGVADTIINNGIPYLKINRAGTFWIKAKHPGNDIYEATSEVTKGPISVSLVTPELHWTTTPDNSTEVFQTVTIAAATNNTQGEIGNITYSVTPGSMVGDQLTLNNCVETTISATIAETMTYSERTITHTFTPAKVTPVLQCSVASLTKTALTNLYLTEMPVTITNSTDIWHDIAVTYSPSDPTIAALDGDHFRLLKSGNCTITANVIAGVNNESSNTIQIQLQVGKADQEITWNLSADEQATHYSGDSFTLTAKCPANNITYTSSNDNIATVSNGVLAFHNAGTVTITAHSAETDVYNAAADVRKTFSAALSDFADTYIGQASTSQSIDLSNLSGATSLTLTSSNPTVFRAFTNNEANANTSLNNSLNISEATTVYVKFYPESVGEATGTITITGDNGKSIAIPVKGKGVQQSVTFGSNDTKIPRGTIESRAISLTNMVSAAGYTVTSNGKSFIVSQPQNGEFTIAFLPQDNTGFSGFYVTIHDNAFGTTTTHDYKINVAGYADEVKTVDFGNVNARSTSSTTRQITLSGVDKVPGLKIASDENTSYLIDNNSSAITATDGQHTVSFTPVHYGTYNGKQVYLYIADNTTDKYPLLKCNGVGNQVDLSSEIVWVNTTISTQEKTTGMAKINNTAYGSYVRLYYTNNGGFYDYNNHPTELEINKTEIFAPSAGTSTVTAHVEALDGSNDFIGENSAEITATDKPIQKISYSSNIYYVVLNDDVVVDVYAYDSKNPSTRIDADFTITCADSKVTITKGTYDNTTYVQQFTIHGAAAGSTTVSITSTPKGTSSGYESATETGIPVTILANGNNCIVSVLADPSDNKFETSAAGDHKPFTLTGAPCRSFKATLNYSFGTPTLNISDGTNTLVNETYETSALAWETKTENVEYTYNAASKHKPTILTVSLTGTKGFIGIEEGTKELTITEFSQLSYFDVISNHPNGSDIDFHNVTVGYASVNETIKVDYSALHKAVELSLTDETNFTIVNKAEVLGKITNCSQWGEMDIIVKYNPTIVTTEENPHTATLTIKGYTTDENNNESIKTYTYTLKGQSSKRTQIITWNNKSEYSVIELGEGKTLTLDAESNKRVYGSSDNKMPVTYTLDNDGGGVATLADGVLTIAKAGTITVIAHQEGDDYTESATDCPWTITFTLEPQKIGWDFINWSNSSTDSIKTINTAYKNAMILEAKLYDNNIRPLNFDIEYRVTTVTGNSCTSEPLVRTEKGSDGKWYAYYNNNGVGIAKITATRDGDENYSKVAPEDEKSAILIINRATPSITYSPTELNNIYVGDEVVLARPESTVDNPSYIVFDYVTGLDEECTTQATNYATLEKNQDNTTTLKAVHATPKIYIRADQPYNECFNERASSNAVDFEVKKTPIAIEWNQTLDLSTGQYDANGAVYQLDGKVKDTRHDKIIDSLAIAYSLTISDKGCNDIPNDQIAKIEGNQLHVYGATSATLTITASQNGTTTDGYADYNAAENVQREFTIQKIKPTITFEPQATMFYGDKVAVTATSALEGLYQSQADGNNNGGISISSANTNAINITNDGYMEAKGVAEGVTLTASQTDNCMVSGVIDVAKNVTVTLGQQKMVWSGEQTASIDVAGSQTFTFNPYAIDKLHTDQNVTWLGLTDGEFKTGNAVVYEIGVVNLCVNSTETDIVSVDENGVIRATGKGTGTVKVWAKAIGDSRYAEITDDEDKVYVDVTVMEVKPAIQSFDISSLNGIHYGDRVKLSSPTTNYFINQGDNKTTFSYADNAAYDISAIGTDTMFDAKGAGAGYTITATQEAIACFNQASDPYTSGQFSIAKSEQEIVWAQTDMNLNVVGERDIQLTAYAIDSRHKDQTTTCLTLTDGKYITAKTSGDKSVNASETDMTITYNVEEQEGVCKVDDEPIVTVDENGLHVTGNGTGSVKITPIVSEGAHYTTATGTPIIVTITKVDPVVTMETIANVTCGATGTLAATATYGGNEGFTFESSNTDTATVSGNSFTALHAGKVRFKVTKAATCITNAQTSDYAQAVIDKADQTVTWNNSETETLFATDMTNGITLSATATSNVTSQATNTEINYSITAGGNLAKIENGKLVSRGAGTGQVTVKATAGTTVNGYEDYNQAEAELTFTVVPDNITFTVAKLELTYGDKDKAFTVTNDKNLDASGYTMTITSIDNTNIKANATNSTHIDAIHAHDGELTVGLKFSGMANYADVETTAVVTVAKATQTITWDDSKSYTISNLTGTINLSDYCTCETGSITYSIPDGTTGVSLDADAPTLIIDEMISETLNVEVTAIVAGDDNYEAASAFKEFNITIELLTITVNGGRTSDNPLDLSTTEPSVTSVTKDVDLAQKMVTGNILSSNYKNDNVIYTFTSDNTDIAKFDNGGKLIIAYKRSDALKLTVTATVDENRKCSTDFYVKIPRGTMVFNNAGTWSDNSKWSRTDMLPSAEDHNVSIAANCTVNVTTAKCYNMEIADNGMLTISTAGILNVADTLLNNDKSKLRIEADANGQGTLIFHNKKYMPQATVEMWCKGSEGDINPNWQYRGIAVSSATLTENAPGLIYQWSETAQTNNEITEQWTQVTDNTMSAWNGYAVAKYTSDGADYKTSAAGALTNADKVINLAYTAGQNSEGVKSGFNLITNSYTAPLNYSKLYYDDGIEEGIVLFNTGKYVDWKNSDKQILSDGNALPGQYIFLPKITGEEITSGLIPSGESFFVVAQATGKSITIPYTAVEQQVNGALRMPERREVYGKLIIEVDGGEGADRLYLLENENRIRGFENGYDGPKYAGTKGNPMLYATTDDGRLSVSADSSLLGQYIGFAAGKHDVTYTISFDASALSGYSELYLYDTREKRYINILDGGTYTFKGLVSGEDKRFKIVGSRRDGESVTGDEQMIIVTGNRFHVSGYDNTDERIYLVDMTGKILWETTTAFGPWFDIPTDIPAGVYVIKTGNHTAKMAVK